MTTNNSTQNAFFIKDLPQEERPREKLTNNGVSALSNAELLSILIGTGHKKESALSLAGRVLSMNERGISYLAECLPEELIDIKGVGMAKAAQIVAAIELGKRIAVNPKEKIVNTNSAETVASLFMEDMRYLKKEYFKVLMLNIKNEILMIDDISVGTLNKTIVHPREVYRNAIRKSAHSVILVHNHPSGNPTPSKDDISLTKRLTEAGDILGIEVLDHIIIGDGIFISMKAHCLI